MTDYQNLKKQVEELNNRIETIEKSITILKNKKYDLITYKQKCLGQIQTYDEFVEVQRNLRRDKK